MEASNTTNHCTQVRSKTCILAHQRISENRLKNKKLIEDEVTSFFACDQQPKLILSSNVELGTLEMNQD
jgi:hypothetical protein